MAKELRFLLDGEDRGQPLNPDEFGCRVSESDLINSRIVSFENELQFGGLIYQYIFDRVVTEGYCRLIEVRVDYKCAGGWEFLTDGYIVVTECKFDYDRCRVSTKLYDTTFSTKINNNKSIPFSLSNNQTKNLEAIVPPARRLLKLFNPAIPTSISEAGRGVSVYDAFKHLVGCMTDNLVGFESDFFFTLPSDTDTICISNGRSIRTNQDVEIVVTFEQLYSRLFAKYELGIGFERSAANTPVLRIEPVEYFFQLNESASLLNQPDIKLTFDTPRLYASVRFGNDPILEANESISGQPLTFIQTPFRGFRNESFGFTGECNTDTVLDVSASDIVFDTNTIEDIFRNNNNTFDLNNVIVQVQYVSSVTPYFEAKQYDPYGIGQSVFNGGFTNEYVSANWINGYPNSLFSFLEEPFDPTTTDFLVQPNVASEIFNDIRFDFDGGFVSILQETGHNAVFFTEVSDPNNLFDFDTYNVPFAGLYTFSSGLVYDALRVDGFPFPIDTTEYGRERKFYIQQYDATDTFIQEFEVSNSGSSKIEAWSELLNVQFVCNQGDKIKVNAAGKRSTQVGGFLSLQRFLDNGTVLGVPRQSYFTGSGIPFDNTELQPVNIDDVRSLLYSFERPLSMVEINSILGNTSSPIQLGRTTDVNAAINGYIKTLEIQSFTRQNANFVLKSNQILR
jgi:hypothetical protein